MSYSYKYRKEFNYYTYAANVFILVIAATCIYLSYNHPIDVSDELRNWSVAHLILHSVPIYIYLKQINRRETNFPFLETLAAFNILHFGFPAFFIKPNDFQLGFLNPYAFQITFYAYFLFYTFFYFFYKVWRLKPIDFIPQNASLVSLKYFCYTLLIIYLTGNFLINDPSIKAIGNIGFYIYLGIFINFWKDGLLKFMEKAIFIPLVLYTLVERAVGGLLAGLALIIFFIALCIIISRSSKIFFVICVAVFVWFYSVFSNLKSAYREKVWFGQHNYTMLEKIALIQELSAQKNLATSTEYVDNYKGKDQFLWRFSYQVSAMSLVINQTPRSVPYWNGESYLPLITKFIPRILWNDKPAENMGYLFGTRYHIISESNTRTSINTPIIPELYLNFGYTGVFIGSILLGLMYAMLTRLFNSRRVSYSSKIIGMALIFPLVIWESNFSLIFGNLLLVSIIIIILYKMVLGLIQK